MSRGTFWFEIPVLVDAMGKKLELTKLDAAKRQLSVAIKLYFEDGDPVSIHTLGLAAFNVLRDLSSEKGVMPVGIKGPKRADNRDAALTGTLLDYIRVNKRKWFYDKLTEAENFFKHADRDPDGTLGFDTMQTELFMYEAVVVYERLAGDLPEEYLKFRTWFHINHPQLFDLPEDKKGMLMGIVKVSRQEYNDELFPRMLRKTRVETGTPPKA